MLADALHRPAQTGKLRRDVHLHGTSLNELLGFIADSLPSWREDVNRARVDAEDALTSQLAAFLNSKARCSDGWDCLQFRTEVPDEQQKNRSIDLVPSPCGAIVWVEGRRCSEYDTLLPIECKRLPTPKGAGRDEWEYVINRSKTTGGIQRFKAGHHGAQHNLAAMIAYIQDDSIQTWHNRISTWIGSLAQSRYAGWSEHDLLSMVPGNGREGLAILESVHSRGNALPDIVLKHLWIVMG